MFGISSVIIIKASRVQQVHPLAQRSMVETREPFSGLAEVHGVSFYLFGKKKTDNEVTKPYITMFFTFVYRQQKHALASLLVHGRIK